MKYNIPDKLAPYLEYIPEDMLEGIITDALESKIFADRRNRGVETSQQVDMRQLLEQIQGLVDNAPATRESTSSSKVVVEEETAVSPVILSTNDKIDDDLKAIVGDFAAGLFK